MYGHVHDLPDNKISVLEQEKWADRSAHPEMNLYVSLVIRRRVTLLNLFDARADFFSDIAGQGSVVEVFDHALAAIEHPI